MLKQLDDRSARGLRWRATSSNDSWVQLDVNRLQIVVDNYVAGGGSYAYYNIPIALPDNQWSHLVATIDKTNWVANIYINGALVTTQALGHSSSNSTIRSYWPIIGADRREGGDNLHGYLDDLRIYNTPLSASQVKTLYDQSAPELQVTVTNQGNAPAAGFWVDLFLNPSSPPTSANQIWSDRCSLRPCYGIAWFVLQGLVPGQQITLSSRNAPANFSDWPGYFAVGTTDIYAYADSYNPGVATGGVLERNESNNRAELHGLRIVQASLPLVASKEPNSQDHPRDARHK